MCEWVDADAFLTRLAAWSPPLHRAKMFVQKKRVSASFFALTVTPIFRL
jgi:hypothetical protein